MSTTRERIIYLEREIEIAGQNVGNFNTREAIRDYQAYLQKQIDKLEEREIEELKPDFFPNPELVKYNVAIKQLEKELRTVNQNLEELENHREEYESEKAEIKAKLVELIQKASECQKKS